MLAAAMGTCVLFHWSSFTIWFGEEAPDTELEAAAGLGGDGCCSWLMCCTATACGPSMAASRCRHSGRADSALSRAKRSSPARCFSCTRSMRRSLARRVIAGSLFALCLS